MMGPQSLQKSKITNIGGNFKNLTWWTFKTQIRYISKTNSYNLIVMSDVDSLKSVVDKIIQSLPYYQDCSFEGLLHTDKGGRNIEIWSERLLGPIGYS